MKTAVLLSLFPAAVLAATQIAGPLSGYVFDPSAHSLRPINGMPGSAALGGPIDLPFAAGSAAASPRLDFALLAGPRGGQVFLATGLRSGQPTVTPLAGAMPAGELVLSGSGAAAVLYSAGSGLVQFISGLPSQPLAAAPVDVSQAGPVATIALNDSGTAALLLAADGTLYAAAAGNGPQFVARIPGAASAAILSDGVDAIVGNAATGDVLLVKNFASAAVISTLAGAAQGIASARDVAAVDAHHAAVIDGSGRLAVIDLDTAAVSWIALAGTAERFAPLDSGLLLLNRPGPQPLLLYAAAQGGSAFFVPPAGSAAASSPHGGATWPRR